MRPAFTGPGYDGNITNTRLNSGQPVAGPGLCLNLKSDHRYHSITTYHVPGHRDEQSHYARSSE